MQLDDLFSARARALCLRKCLAHVVAILGLARRQRSRPARPLQSRQHIGAAVTRWSLVVPPEHGQANGRGTVRGSLLPRRRVCRPRGKPLIARPAVAIARRGVRIVEFDHAAVVAGENDERVFGQLVLIGAVENRRAEARIELFGEGWWALTPYFGLAGDFGSGALQTGSGQRPWAASVDEQMAARGRWSMPADNPVGHGRHDRTSHGSFENPAFPDVIDCADDGRMAQGFGPALRLLDGRGHVGRCQKLATPGRLSLVEDDLQRSGLEPDRPVLCRERSHSGADFRLCRLAAALHQRDRQSQPVRTRRAATLRVAGQYSGVVNAGARPERNSPSSGLPTPWRADRAGRIGVGETPPVLASQSWFGVLPRLFDAAAGRRHSPNGRRVDGQDDDGILGQFVGVLGCSRTAAKAGRRCQGLAESTTRNERDSSTIAVAARSLSSTEAEPWGKIATGLHEPIAADLPDGRRCGLLLRPAPERACRSKAAARSTPRSAAVDCFRQQRGQTPSCDA